MIGKRRAIILIFAVLFLFSSAAGQESKSFIYKNNIINALLDNDNLFSNGTKFEDLNSTPAMDYMTNGLSQVSWQRCLGGSKKDEANSIQQTSDGGYIVAGATLSNDGDVSGNRGGFDFWVVRLDSLGNSQWLKCLGGSSEDDAYSIQLTADGGYIVAGYSMSNDGDVSGNHGNGDFWVVKLDSLGNIQWQKCLGGSNGDWALSIRQTTDGGYIVAGYTLSNDGDVSGNHGSGDFWAVKLDSLGNIQWRKCLGGTNFDCANSIQQTADRGYIVAGYTYSNDGDVSGNHGNGDFWVVKLDRLENIQWQRCLGGSNDDWAFDIRQTSDGGYVVAGFTESNDGDVSGNHGDGDCWVAKLDGLGNIQWQKCLGGSDLDYAHSIQQTADGGYIVAGYTWSNNGDVSGNRGDSDFWVVKLDSLGSIQWQKCLGGSNVESALCIQQTADGGYIVDGTTRSNNGDVSGNHGNDDFWVVLLPNNPPSTPDKPSGPRSGSLRKVCTYTTSAIDPDGDRIKYIFNWGDGTTSATGFVDSGMRAAASHCWFRPGRYQVRAMAVDNSGASSGWSEATTVTEMSAIARIVAKPG